MQVSEHTVESSAKEKTYGTIGRLELPALWLLVLVFVATIALRLLGIKAASDPPYLLFSLDLLIIGIPAFLTAAITARGFLRTGAWPILWLGIGTVAFALATVEGGFLVERASANVAVTVHNLIAFFAASLYCLGAFFTLNQVSPHQEGRTQRLATLLQVHLVTLAVVIFVTVVSIRELLPLFFREGEGGTFLRQTLVGTATALFLFASLVMLREYLRSQSHLLYWYSLGLLLMSLGMGGIFMETAMGTPLNWMGRGAQLLGGIYLLMAALVTLREAKAKQVTSGEVLANLLSQTEAKLKESEEKYRNIVETANEGVWISDRSARTIFVNKKMTELLGYSQEEMVDKTVYDFMDQEARKLAKSNLERGLQGNKDRYEQKYIRKDGSTLWAIVSAAPILGNNGKTIASLGMITDYHRAQGGRKTTSGDGRLP